MFLFSFGSIIIYSSLSRIHFLSQIKQNDRSIVIKKNFLSSLESILLRLILFARKIVQFSCLVAMAEIQRSLSNSEFDENEDENQIKGVTI